VNDTAYQLISHFRTKISSPSEAARTTARVRLDTLTKPTGSLGRLEDLAAQWVSIRQDRATEPVRKAVYVFAADHGVTAENVSAYPREVTRQMVLNYVAGGAAINVVTHSQNAALYVVDVGVDADLSETAGLLHRKIARGTMNMLHEAAMSPDQLLSALTVGVELATEAAAGNCSLIAIGEMGIGNTTSASAITCALTGVPATLATGRGTGIDEATRQRKISVVEGVLQQHPSREPLAILQTMGGFEVAAIVGMVLGAASHRVAVLCDGFISTASAALAVALVPDSCGYLIAGHESVEPGHRLLLERLGLTPVLSLNMRLGEGTGAALAMPIVESAIAIYLGMATFATAGVSEATQ
jgi:nicotinate-nucleotide--dimethylbenzimidazole phosphoribosyltransferase